MYINLNDLDRTVSQWSESFQKFLTVNLEPAGGIWIVWLKHFAMEIWGSETKHYNRKNEIPCDNVRDPGPHYKNIMETAPCETDPF